MVLVGLLVWGVAGPGASTAEAQVNPDPTVREPRPRCPLHGYALAPSGTLRGAVWECPDDGTLWWCYMGQYQQAVSSD